MGQLTGVLALLLSETPVLPLNVSRYTSALQQAVNTLQPSDSAVLGMQNELLLHSDKKPEILFQLHFEMQSLILV
jgi:hypothetical protein